MLAKKLQRCTLQVRKLPCVTRKAQDARRIVHDEHNSRVSPAAITEMELPGMNDEKLKAALDSLRDDMRAKVCSKRWPWRKQKGQIFRRT